GPSHCRAHPLQCGSPEARRSQRSCVRSTRRDHTGVRWGIQLAFNKCADVLRLLDSVALQSALEDILTNLDSRVDLGLEDFGLRRIHESRIQLRLSDLVSDGLGGDDKHLVCHSLRLCGVDRQADGGENVQVVALTRGQRLVSDTYGRKLYARGVNRPS